MVSDVMQYMQIWYAFELILQFCIDYRILILILYIVLLYFYIAEIWFLTDYVLIPRPSHQLGTSED